MPDVTIRGIIELLLKHAGLREGSRELEKIAQAAGRGSKSLDAVGTSLSTLQRGLVRFLGAAAIARYVQQSVLAFAQFERQVLALEFRMERLGLGGRQAVGEVVERLKAIGREGGAGVEETIPAFTKFVGILKDTEAALAAVKLANDIAEAGTGDYAQAVGILTQILQGRAQLAAREFGLELNKVSGEAKTNAELAEELIRQIEGFGSATADTQSVLERLRNSIRDATRDLGEGLAPTFKVLGELMLGFLSTVQDLGSTAVAAFSAMSNAVLLFGKSAAAALDIRSLVSDPKTWLQGLKDAWSDYADTNAEILDDLLANWDSHHAEQRASEQTHQSALNTLIAFARRKSLEEDQKLVEEAAEKRRELEFKAEQAIAQARVQAAQQGSRERLAAELDLLRLEERQALDAARSEAEKKLRLRLAALTEERHIAAQKARERGENEADVIVSYLDQERALRIGYEKETGPILAQIRKAFRIREQTLTAEHEKLLASQILEAEREVLEARLGLMEENAQARARTEIEALDAAFAEKRAKVEENDDAVTALLLARQIARQALLRKIEIEDFLRGVEIREDLLESASEREQEILQGRLETLLADEKGNAEAIYDVQRALIDLQEADEVGQLERRKERDVQESIARGELWEETTQIAIAADNRITAAHARATRARTKLDELEKKRKRELLVEGALLAANAIETLWPKTKAGAIANAIVNTAEGVTKALTLPPPLNFVVAALVAAAGLKQIQTIRKTNLGSSSADFGTSGAAAGGAAGVGAVSSTGAPIAPTVPREPIGPDLSKSRSAEKEEIAADKERRAAEHEKRAAEMADRAILIVPRETAQRASSASATATILPRSFDDPRNDMLAAAAGRRSASDLVRHFESGFRQQLVRFTERVIERQVQPVVSAPTTQVTNVDQSQPMSLVVHGHVLGGRAGERALARLVAKALARDESRRIR